MARLKLTETEDDVKKLVLKWFKKFDGYSFAPVSRGMGVHGIPDRVGCIPVLITPNMVGKIVGMFVGIEAKKPGRRGEKCAGASGLQVDQLTEIAEAGGLAYIVDAEEDLSFLSEFIRQLQNTKDLWGTTILVNLRRRLGLNG